MTRAWVWVVLGLSSTCWAEASWLTARGRLLEETRLEVWGGPRTVGLGLVSPDGPGARAGLGAEVAYVIPDRVAELRGSRVWQFTAPRFGTASASLGITGIVVPEGNFDLGVGPHAGLVLALGGEHFTVDLGLQTGLELFVRQQGPRLPQRALLGLNFHLGQLSVSVMARIGADLLPGHPFVGRGEFIVALGWLGLAR
jgi:hypothetical protein